MTTSSSTKHSSLSIRASEIVCKHSENAFFIFESSFAFLFWSSLFCICISVNDIFANESITQNFRCLYEQHQQDQISQKCVWFVQTKKAQKNYLMRKHESKIKNKLKQKTKKTLKQKEKIRIATKRIEKYTCKRCKHSIKFDNNIKLHEHIRTRHAKKSKSIVSQISKSKFISSVSSFQSMISSFFSSFQSVIESSATSFTSSKLLSFSIFTSTVVRERSKNVSSKFSSIATSRKSIFWIEIASRSVVASKFSRFSIATFKSMCKFSKNANVVCSSASFRTSTSSKLYLIVNDLYRMFVEKSNSFDLQSNQKKSLSSRNLDKCNSKNNCKFNFIQNRITSYFHATISSASKSIKFETFESTHARENVSRQFSIFSRSIWFISFLFRFSRIFRSFSVCKHCQKRFVIYWFIDWITSNVSKVENNEIFMKMRYWRFASFHSTLRKYWLFYFEKIITLRKLTCCLFVVCSLFFFINRWSIWKN